MLDNEEIIDFIENYGECEYLDFKIKEYDKHSFNELLKDIMAFANAHNENDKYIIIGVKKLTNGDIQFNDIDNITDDAVYQDFITQYMEKNIIFNYLPFNYNGHKLAVFKISKDNYSNRPFLLKKDYIKDGKVVFRSGEGRIRHGSSTSPLNSKDYEKIFNSNKQICKLSIKTFKDNSIFTNLSYDNFDNEYDGITDNLQLEIKELLTIINNTTLDMVTPALENAIKIPHSFLSEKEIGKVSIDENIIEHIKLYCEKFSYTLNDNFFDIGNLKEFEKINFSNGSLPYTHKYTKGTSIEKEKYSNIIKLHDLILKFIYLKNYLDNLIGLNFFRFILCNEGSAPDEDIEVSLLFPKGILANTDNFINESRQSADFSKKMFNKWFDLKRQPNIDTYNETEFNFNIDETYYDSVLFRKYKKSQEDMQEELKDIINDYITNDIFCYDIIKSDEFDIIRYSQNKLMHNTNCFFPSVIVLKEIPTELNYEIKSKNMEKILKGKICL